jgi:hypothetical protein
MISEQTVGIDFGRIELGELEHQLISRMGRAAREIATHIVDGRYVGSVVSTELRNQDFEQLFPDACLSRAVFDVAAEVQDRARVLPVEVAADRHAARHSGRLVRFGGDERLPPIASVGHITDNSDINVVVGLGADVTDEHLVHLNGFVRPVFVGGRIVLHVTAGGDATLRTFETANPHQCCGGH